MAAGAGPVELVGLIGRLPAEFGEHPRQQFPDPASRMVRAKGIKQLS